MRTFQKNGVGRRQLETPAGGCEDNIKMEVEEIVCRPTLDSFGSEQCAVAVFYKDGNQPSHSVRSCLLISSPAERLLN
jgi:hypothetical protein